MKVTTAAIFSTLFCAEAALAAALPAAVPEDRRLARRLARRESRALRRSALYKETVVEHATVESNWGGAILTGSGFTAASATANVPLGSGGSSAGASAWVGIDGYTCDSAILQTGFDWYGDGTYDAWYEWYPAYAADFDLTISEGDEIQMSVVATSLTSGTATLENLTTGDTVTETFTDVTDGSLCETSAEFIIEDFEECDSDGSNCEFVTFSPFSPAVEFTSVSATADGESVALSGATISEVIVNNEDLTSCSVSGTTLTCTYE